MKRPLLLFLFLAFAFKTTAQEEKPTPFERIVQSMKGIDTFMVYGDFCSGCMRGTERRIHVIWKRKGVVWIRSYEYEYPFENVDRTWKVPYGKDPFAFYEANKEAVNILIGRGSSLKNDPTYDQNGGATFSEGFNHGQAQEIYLHYPDQTLNTLFCCGRLVNYQKKAPLLVSFLDLFPKELDAQFIPQNPDPVIYSETW